MKPRKVRGGVKLPAAATTMTSQLAAQVGLSKDGVAGKNVAKDADETTGGGGALSWASHRWVRLMEQAAEGSRLVEGLEYARLGQTRKLNITKGGIDALVQGRSERAYITRIVFDVFDETQWEKVVAAMATGAIYGAKLLSGELPANIEDIFAPMGLKLFPLEPSEVQVSCTCGEASLTSPLAAAPIGANAVGTPDTPAAPATEVSAPVPSMPVGATGTAAPINGWCKHVCCVAHLFAARLATEPFLMFGIRGLEVEEIRERLRERRTSASMGAGAMPVYAQRVPGASDVPNKPLEECVDDFWEAGPGLRELELPIGPPPVSHPLLRRLGPSPFTGAAFPLVGLLASCYEAISAEAVKEREGESVVDNEKEQAEMDEGESDEHENL